MKRRDFVLSMGLASAMSALPAGAGAESPQPSPWVKRLFRLYTGGDGDAAIEQIKLDDPKLVDSQFFIRQVAERVSMGALAPNYIIDWHPANQPTLLIPLFGELLVRLKNNAEYIFSHGDVLFAEDCQGPGHISGTTGEGAFIITIQLPNTDHCLDSSAPPLDPRYTEDRSPSEIAE